MRTLGAICSMVLAAALFAVCISILAIRALGMGAFVVTGSSMEPAIAKGSLAIVEPVDPAIVGRGDIITFDHYGQMTTHRVIAVNASSAERIFTTKGDANVSADPEPVHFPGQVGLYRASVPLLGYLVAYTQAYWRLALTLLAGVVFLGCAAMLIFGNLRPRRIARRPRLVTVATDSDELWTTHVGWLSESTTRQIRVA